jgi:DNA polymerase III alpha subunit
MKINEYGQVEITADEAVESLYSGKIKSLTGVYIEEPDRSTFNQARELLGDRFPALEELVIPDMTVEEFDRQNQSQWYMPEEYRLYDIVDWLYCECRTPEQKDRVTEELKLFAQHNMIDLLKYIKYLVDTMRKNDIVWGVGRGSSVASYVLYLIGVHKVDSIKYELDIREFLK